MQILEILRDAQGGHSVESLAAAYGITPEQADAVLATVVPELARNLERNTLSRGGLADFVTAIGSGRHEGFLSDPNAARSPAIRAEGNAILGHMLATKDKSRAIAHLGAVRAGVGEAIVKAMLPTIAAMVMGAIAKGAKGGLGDILARLPAGGGNARPTANSTGTGWSLPGGGDSRQRAGQSPLPLPGERPTGGYTSGGGQRQEGGNPYGDIADILRRGGGVGPGNSGPRSPGSRIPGPAGSGVLWTMVRSVLGGLLGFQSRGVMGWIIKAVVARYGLTLLRAILGRAFGGR